MEKTRRWGETQEEVPPSPMPLQAPPFQQARKKTWDPEALQLTRVCDLEWLLVLSGPRNTLPEVVLIDQVGSLHPAQPLPH